MQIITMSLTVETVSSDEHSHLLARTAQLYDDAAASSFSALILAISTSLVFCSEVA